ncbi:hypothetical protein [Okeania sp. SIO3I5]|uniref:hypothetical protein n=1 Tax=Okeania sp. SIO3I5 TaxID=2607805 RepID=UPI0025FF7075|nr:hypothetical protein [Okeania sp. SIO3I5]
MIIGEENKPYLQKEFMGRKESILIVTSIAPGNTERQKAAIQSWYDLGFSIVSLNIKSEVQQLQPVYDNVDFHVVEQDGSDLYGKPYVYINDLLDYIRKYGATIGGIINSDIHLRVDKQFLSFIFEETQNSVVFAPRLGVESLEATEGNFYPYGFDAFFFDKKLLKDFPRAEFCLGVPYWDLWVPFIAVKKSWKLKYLEDPVAVHIDHAENWSKENWFKAWVRFAKFDIPTTEKFTEDMWRGDRQNELETTIATEIEPRIRKTIDDYAELISCKQCKIPHVIYPVFEPLTDAGFKAQITAPENLAASPGEGVKIKVTVKNISTEIWRASYISQIKLANYWLDKNGGKTQYRASDLSKLLKPRESIDLRLIVTMPETPGNYLLGLDMLQEGVAWFEEKGSQATRVKVNVRPLTDAGFKAQIIAQESLAASPGEKVEIKVTVKNISREVWSAGYISQIQLGNCWLNENGEKIRYYDGRTFLPQLLKPTESIDLPLTIIIPETPGNYLLELDMVQEGVAWFRERGSQITRVKVEVKEKWQLKTPVAFFIYKRPDTTEKVFEAIRQVQPPKLLVIADGPKAISGESEKCMKTRAIIDQVDWDCEVITNYSRKNLGCRRRVASGVDWVFQQVESAIIIEDDCLPDPTFFRFCEELLERYKDDERVMQISGTNAQYGNERTKYSYFFSIYKRAWGWASWRRAWNHYDVNMTQWEKLKNTNWLEYILRDKQAVKYWSNNFQWTYDGQIDTWDHQWQFNSWIHNGLSIIPSVNLVTNIGCSPEGTNCIDPNDILANLPKEKISFPLKHPNLVERNMEADEFEETTIYSVRETKRLERIREITPDFDTTIFPVQKCFVPKFIDTELLTDAGLSVSPNNIIVTHIEVNNRHGTGILIKRMFEDSSNIFAIRSRNQYDGKQDFGQVATVCECYGMSRYAIFCKVAKLLEGIHPERVLCIPYFVEDFYIALAVQALFGIKLCTYIMDDQNIYAKEISDELMQEVLEVSTLRLAISSEMRDAYENKYGLKFWLLPAVVPSHLLVKSRKLINSDSNSTLKSNTGILVGNIWGQTWLDRLQETLRYTPVTIDWYVNIRKTWLKFDEQELEKVGLIPHDVVPEEQLVKLLCQYPFSILPTGINDEKVDRPEIAKLSLPSKIPFIAATSGTPIIVLGSRDTVAARFVEYFEIGVVCNYNSDDFYKAVTLVSDEKNQMRMRENGMKLGNSLSAKGMDKWIWESLEVGKACDLRFEDLMPRC